jgi:hypothetical protein
MWPKSFQEAFCDRFACSPGAYERRVFWQSIHRRSLPIALLIFVLFRRYFDLDMQTIRQLGVSRSAEEFRGEIESFRYEYRMRGGFFRETLGVRISGKRLMALLYSTFPQTPGQTR